MHDILILGGGYAGVTVAARLRGIEANVTLVNEHSYHHLTTLLHQPVVGHRNYQDLSVPLKDLLPRGFQFVRGRVERIVSEQHEVEIRCRDGRRSLRYGTLVVALGWEPQFYDISGLAEHALTLRNLNQSRLAHNRIEEAFIAYDEQPDQHWRTSIVVGGGGLTGVELAGELADSRAEWAARFDMKKEDITISIVDGGPTLLHGLDPWLVEQSTAHLQAKGVRCLTGRHIQEVRTDGVVLAGGETIEAGTIIWAGGIRGSSVLETSGFDVNKQGRAQVNEFLQVVDHPDIFVIGDCALARDLEGEPLPPTAQLAVEQGESVAHGLRAVVKGGPPVPYVPRPKGIVLSIGRKYALGVVMGRHISGMPAGLLKDLIAYRYLSRIGGLGLALKKFFQWRHYTAAMRKG